LGLALLGGTGADDIFGGLNAGLRVQSPSRLAPFAGVGMFHGASSYTMPAEDDWIDNDDDGSTDERGEERTDWDGWLSAVYPEVGVHYWLASNVRLTASGAYYVTTEGRDSDFWFYGVSLSFLRDARFISLPQPSTTPQYTVEPLPSISPAPAGEP
jgi:hypothetical protein